MSPLPPAAKGKMIRVSGPDSAEAAPILVPAVSARALATNSRRFIRFLPALDNNMTHQRAPGIELLACVAPDRAAKQPLFSRSLHDQPSTPTPWPAVRSSKVSAA